MSEPAQAAALVGAEMTRSTDRLRLLQLRDSLTRVAPNARDGLVVMIDRAYSDSTSRALDTLVHSRWQRAGAPSRVPVVIAAVLDSSSTVSGFPRRKQSSYNLPITTFLPSCGNWRSMYLDHPHRGADQRHCSGSICRETS